LIADIDHAEGYLDRLAQANISQIDLFPVHFQTGSVLHLKGSQGRRILIPPDDKKGQSNQKNPAKCQE
jgi:hypothetical protein